MQEEQNQYDFITDNAQPAKKSLLPASGNKKQRILIVAGGAVLLLILLMVGIAFISNIGKGDTKQLVSLAQQHAELVRVAEIGEDKARGQAARNLAVTTKLAMQSSQTELLATIGKSRKVSKDELAAGKDTKTDEKLTTAEQNNEFDEAFTDQLLGQIEQYRSDLNQAFKATNVKSTRESYAGIYKQLEALLLADEEPETDQQPSPTTE